jgi:parallel beta-helix repeat protein
MTVIIALLLYGAFSLRETTPVNLVEHPLTLRSNILIQGDRDFTQIGAGMGCGCVRSGSGSQEDPYVIAGWSLNASVADGISISGTRAYFLIRGVDVQGESTHVGIFLKQVENGRIEDSLIAGNSVGVYAFDSSNLVFVRNRVIGNRYGIWLEASNNNLLILNRLETNEEVAIFVRGSDSVVRNNNVTRNGFGGINIDGTSGFGDGNVVEGNVVNDNLSYGITMWHVRNSIVTGNNVTKNGTGIALTDESHNNTVKGNNVTQNDGNGIALLEGSSENTVKGNTAKGNGNGADTFDLYDAGSNNIWNDNTYGTKNPDTLASLCTQEDEMRSDDNPPTNTPRVEPQQRNAHPTEDQCGSMNLPISVAERINTQTAPPTLGG